MEENVHYVYWGSEDRMDTQDKERGERVILAVGRLISIIYKSRKKISKNFN